MRDPETRQQKSPRVQRYPEYETAYPEQHWTLLDVLEASARKFGDRPFLRWLPTGEMLTYSGVLAATRTLAAGLMEAGLMKGDRVAFILENSLDHVLLWLACSQAGIVDAPLNPIFRGSFLRQPIALIKASACVLEAEKLADLEAVIDELPSVRLLVVRGNFERQKYPRLSSRCTFLELKKVKECRKEFSRPDIDLQDLQSIMYTSGTTGPSKGVQICNAQMYFFADQVVHFHTLTPHDVILAPVPLFHISGRVFGVYAAMIAGCEYAMYEKFSASMFVNRLYECRATVVHMIGGMMLKIFQQPPTDRDRGHRWRSAFSGPTAFDIEAEFKSRFGLERLVEGLGQTEVCQPVMTPPGQPRPSGSAGVLSEQWFEARVVDPATDQEVPPGTIGEYVVRSKHPWLITLGYENMPDKTVEATRNLWFHTGDAVRMDENGWFYFIDRLKDCIRRRGENISSYEVEVPVQAYSDVEEVAVIAVKSVEGDPEDEVMCCVVPRQGRQIDLRALNAWMSDQVPHYAVPRYYRILSELPKTPNNKVQKARLRADGITQDTWDRTKTLD